MRSTSKTGPVQATQHDPMHGPTPTWVHGKGRRPGTLLIGSKSGADTREVPANTVKFKFGPDSEMFGMPYADPYAQNESVGFKLTRSQLRAMILEVLTEGEDAGGDEEADDLFGGDEGGDDEGGDEGGEEAGGDEGGDEEGGDEGVGEEGGDEEEAADDSEKDEKKDSDKEPEPTGPVGDEVDIALKDVMADFEKRALDAAKSKGTLEPVSVVKKEGRISLARLLFEQDNESPLIDMSTFAADIARLISNYDTLIDMEGVIYSKAKDFLEKKYGKEYSDQLEDILAREYDIEFDHVYDPEKAEKPIYAVGASASSGGA